MYDLQIGMPQTYYHQLTSAAQGSYQLLLDYLPVTRTPNIRYRYAFVSSTISPNPSSRTMWASDSEEVRGLLPSRTTT
jgi:hypothetical protein